jgi:hypothetical protein
MKSVGGHGSLSLLFVMKGGDGPLLCGQPSQGCYDHTHCYYLLIVVVISLQFHMCVSVWRIWVHEVPALQIERM